MTHRTRTFTRDQLEEIGVPHELGGDGCATELADDNGGSRRWTEIRRLIFRAPDDGKAYLVLYQTPLTEHQECDTWFNEDEITATEMEQQPVTVMQWKPVQDA
ncbi:hypothetical protein [Streptomyces xanthophaeus]|uniref:hypothetical protein n=1 Tax=Streptomyces xanthophaeus TaxID=67385 RepID=UPI003669396B